MARLTTQTADIAAPQSATGPEQTSAWVDRLSLWTTGLALLTLMVGSVFRLAAINPFTQMPFRLSAFGDDGFYYLEIARNFVKLGQFTFDGINRTNGFHPLWQLLLIGLASLSTDDVGLMRLVLGLGVVIFFITGLLLLKYVRRHGGDLAGLAAVVVWSLAPGLVLWPNQGMENTVFLPALLWTLLCLDDFCAQPARIVSAIRLGAASALMIWARSDSVLLAALILGALAALALKRPTAARWPGLRAVAAVAAVVALGGTSYLAFNALAAGSVSSVSGVIKVENGLRGPWTLTEFGQALRFHLSMLWNLFSGFGGLNWKLNRIILPMRLIFVGGLLNLLVSAGLWWRSRSRWARPAVNGVARYLSLSLLLLYAGLLTAILVTLLRDVVYFAGWYVVPQVTAVLVFVPLALFPRDLLEKWLPAIWNRVSLWLAGRGPAAARFSGLAPRLAGFGGGAAFIFGVLPSASFVPYVQQQAWQSAAVQPGPASPNYELAAWLNANVPPSARVGMYDAGATGYFADAHVVNLDGLVNSPQYLEVLRSQRVADYVVQNRFDYVIAYYAAHHPFILMGPVADSTEVCHQLVHTNTGGMRWWIDSDDTMYFQVIALRYGAPCELPWQGGYPFAAVEPD